MNTELIAYYRERAREYEKIYLKPERQPDLQRTARWLQQIFCNKHVFEIACGTGYWTERLAQTAARITATDINPSVLQIAEAKTYAPVSFETADIYQLQNVTQQESLFGGFIWSHIPFEKLGAFLKGVHHCVQPGGTIVFMDNCYVSGNNLSISHSDAHGNTYQTRQLENGTTYAVLKNFPEPHFLQTQLRAIATEINITTFTYFWIASCKNK